MKQNFELRNEALSTLKGNWGRVILLLFITIISYVILITIVNKTALYHITTSIGAIMVSNISFLSNIFILLPLSYLFLLKLLTFTRNRDARELTSNLFGTLKENYIQSIAVLGLTTIYSFLWALLFFLPDIVKSYSYALAKYIQMDNKELSAEECIQRSMKMMEGHKMQLFLLDLGFILRWFAIPLITVVIFIALILILDDKGISAHDSVGYALLILLAGLFNTYLALIYFVPYIETARIYFYEDLKSSLETKAIEE